MDLASAASARQCVRAAYATCKTVGHNTPMPKEPRVPELRDVQAKLENCERTARQLELEVEALRAALKLVLARCKRCRKDKLLKGPWKNR